jgi:hypothetical protein
MPCFLEGYNYPHSQSLCGDIDIVDIGKGFAQFASHCSSWEARRFYARSLPYAILGRERPLATGENANAAISLIRWR